MREGNKMYEKLFFASSLAIILIGCSKHNEAILVNMPILKEAPELGENEVFKSISGGRVFFSFDRSELSSASMIALNKQVEWFSKNPNVSFIIEGHTDERGTSKYNLDLGRRRAASVRKYFLDKGISANRITAISFGKEFPDDTAHNSDAWAKNRRSVTIITRKIK